MARAPASWVSWNRVAATPAMTMRLALFCAVAGVRSVPGLITGGRWCWGTAAFAPCFLIRCAAVLAMRPLSPAGHRAPVQRMPGADRVGTVTELGRHKLGKHSATNLSPELDDYELAAELVREAGQLALMMRQGGLDAQRKTSISDVVTAADHAAEAYVLEQLQRCRPDDAVLGEEGASVAGSSGRTWVIDPVDGTFNFLHGSTYWCSAIALKDSSGAG